MTFIFICVSFHFHYILVIGGPGSGKGTQCERLLADTSLGSGVGQEDVAIPKIYHLNVGGLLREEQNKWIKQIEEGVPEVLNHKLLNML